MRINSRIEAITFATRPVDPRDITIIEGLPVTRPERTLVDLCLDFEGPSLIEDAFLDAVAKGIDANRIGAIIESLPGKKRNRDALAPLDSLLSPA